MKSTSLLVFAWLLLATVAQELSTVEPALNIIDCCDISCFNTNIDMTTSEQPCSRNRDLCLYEATFLLNETNLAILPSTIKKKCTKCTAGNNLKHANDSHTFSFCCYSQNCNGDEQRGEERFLSSKLQEAFKNGTLKNDDDDFKRVLNAYLKKSATTSSTSSTTSRRPLPISDAVEGSGPTENMSIDLTDSAEEDTTSFFNSTTKETSPTITNTTFNGATAAQSKSSPTNNFSTAPVMTTYSLPSFGNNGTAASESAGGEWVAPLVGTIVCLFLGAAGVAGAFFVYRFMLRRHMAAIKAATDDSSVQL